MANATGFWKGQDLWWRIGSRTISDAELRGWCSANMCYPHNHVDVIRQVHVDAWARAQPVCPDCDGDGEAARSTLGACVPCPTCMPGWVESPLLRDF